MTRPRDRASAAGLLPRMEAMPWKDGRTVSYRYHPLKGKPIGLGTDRQAAIQRVLDMTGEASDHGTVAELWRLYLGGPYWRRLAASTQRSYSELSKPLLAVFGAAHAAAIKPQHVVKYLRDERRAAPVVANREIAVLSNLMNLAVEMGWIDANPCKQVRRNPEQPRSDAPAPELLEPFLAWALARGGQSRVLAGAAEFAAIAGSRGCEFRPLAWTHVDDDVVRLKRSKQRKRIVFEAVAISPRLQALLERMRPLATDQRLGYVFPNARGNAYTSQAFKLAWSRLMTAAIAAGVVPAAQRFTFHDLRAYYVTQFEAATGTLPRLHANPDTTARVYNRPSEVGRDAL